MSFLDYSDRVKVFNKFEQPGTGLVKYSNLYNLFELLGLDPPKYEVSSSTCNPCEIFRGT